MTIGTRPRSPSSTRLSRQLVAPRCAPLAGLDWRGATQLFLECWAADHPGVRLRTLDYYREQLERRLKAFACERGIARIGDFDRYDMRGFVAWLEAYVTHFGRPLTQRGKHMALNAAKMLFRWLCQEGLLPEDVGACVRSYRLDGNTVRVSSGLGTRPERPRPAPTSMGQGATAGVSETMARRRVVGASGGTESGCEGAVRRAGLPDDTGRGRQGSQAASR